MSFFRSSPTSSTTPNPPEPPPAPGARSRASSSFPSLPSFSSLGSFFGAPTSGSPVSEGGPGAGATPRTITPEQRQLARDVDSIITTAKIPLMHVDAIEEKLKPALVGATPEKIAQILREARTPCVGAYLTDVFRNLDKMNASFEAEVATLKNPKERESFLEDGNRIAQTYYAGIVELFVSGMEVALKPNLEKNAEGVVIGVKLKDRTRFAECHAFLRQQAGLPVDYELPAQGRGRTRRRRHKQKKNKTKARKMRSRR